MTKLQLGLGTGVVLLAALLATTLLSQGSGSKSGERRVAFFDGNGDGTVDEEDLRAFLAKRDTDQSSTLSLKEFVVGATPDHLPRVERGFKTMDRNSDGFLDWDELRLQAGPGPLASEAKIRRFLEALDTDSDGLLSKVEYAADGPTEPKRDATEDFLRFDLDRDEQLSFVELQALFSVKGTDGPAEKAKPVGAPATSEREEEK